LRRPDTRIIASDRPHGVGNARNLGWRAAEGEIIAMLDDDDHWLPDYLAAVRRACAMLPEPLFVFTDCFDYRAGEAPQHMVHEAGQLYPDLIARMLYDPFPHCSSIFACTRARLAAIGGYDESLWKCQDSDLYLRLLAGPGAATPVQVERPLAMRLLHRRGVEADRVAAATLQHYDALLTKFFASSAGAAYRPIEADVRAKTTIGIERRFRFEAGALAP
jgi:glycosyltransferase involved in cell wall biosynthesis